jgi:hypothetical protein
MGELSFQFAGMQFDRYKVLFTASCALRLMIVLLLLPLIANVKQDKPENVESYEVKGADEDVRKEPA